MLTFRFLKPEDVGLLFNWANDELSRANSYNSDNIRYEDHVNWFNNILANHDPLVFIFEENSIPVGQVRIKKEAEGRAIISINVDANFRGKGYAGEMIRSATSYFLEKNKSYKIWAYVFKTNLASYNSFLKGNFTLLREELVNGVSSFVMTT